MTVKLTSTWYFTPKITVCEPSVKSSIRAYVSVLNERMEAGDPLSQHSYRELPENKQVRERHEWMASDTWLLCVLSMMFCHLMTVCLDNSHTTSAKERLVTVWSLRQHQGKLESNKVKSSASADASWCAEGKGITASSFTPSGLFSLREAARFIHSYTFLSPDSKGRKWKTASQTSPLLG